jgi:hypothetical protein
MSWNLIQRLSAPTSDKFTFTGLSLSSYQRVMLLLDAMKVGTDDAAVLLQLSTGGTLRTSGYRYYITQGSSGGSNNSSNSTSASSIRIAGTGNAGWGVGNAASSNATSRIYISNSNVALYKTIDVSGTVIHPSGNASRIRGGGILEQTGNTDGITISLSTGTLTSGTAALYGLPTS